MLIYEACDSLKACTPGIVTISINHNPPDVAPVTANDAIVVGPNGSTSTLVGGATNVLANDQRSRRHAKGAADQRAAEWSRYVECRWHVHVLQRRSRAGCDSWEYEACDSDHACTAATVSVTINGNAPTVTCMLPGQVNVVGDTISIDLSLLFAPPSGQTLTYTATNVPPSLSITGSLLSGTLQANDVPALPPYIYPSTLTATTLGTNLSASENVTFQVLPTGEILFRSGFDNGVSAQPCH